MFKIVSAVVLATILSLLGIGSALAERCEHTSGYDFGQHHAEMARAGMLDGSMNPGMHKGYSPNVP